jgi:EAL domain-containing protein (putative c-di-GMP-specific phosphodiesterase class I)
MEDTDLDEGLVVAERMLAALAVPVTIDAAGLQVQISIGLATAVPGENTAEEVLRNADVAMYWAKDRGKSTVAIYDAGLHDEALARLQLRSDLQRAMRDDQLTVHYQPIVSLVTGTITGFEALARWHHPVHGLLQPVEFIPLAEETGLILPLGSWVLRTACTFAASLQTDWRRPTLAVNVAARQLAQPGFVDEVLSVLTASGLPPNRLTLELTESVVLTEFETVAPRLVALRDAGVRIAIDDFGTGYSSLSYLSRLPVDVLKIDKSFVDGVPDNEHNAALTRTILEMSRSLDMSTVAEGVESDSQAQWLRDERCTFGQGFLWSRPVDVAGVLRLLAATPVPPQPDPVRARAALTEPSAS